MTQTASEDSLFRQATALQRQNRTEEAIVAYARLLQAHPGHLRGLNRLGICFTAIGRNDQALALFDKACELHPHSAISLFNKGRVLARLGRRQEARGSLESAVSLDPDLAIAWLHLGKSLIPDEEDEKALYCFHRALELNPDLSGLPMQPGAPDELRQMVREAKAALRGKYIALHNQAMESLATQLSRRSLERVGHCIDIQHGSKKAVYEHALHKPESIYFPGLPSTPWFEREQFSWLADFESRWQLIRSEFLALGTTTTGFTPYVTDGPTVPDAMKNLAGSHAWDSFHFYIGGRRQDENCNLCPETAHGLEALPLASMPGVAPEAFFSILRPGAHIRPHHGIANTKVAVHLPLVVPEGCALRVGDETRSWREGECLIFDDSFEHEAWNRGKEPRTVLIFEVWNPYLKPEEIMALQHLAGCVDEWAKSAGSLFTN